MYAIRSYYGLVFDTPYSSYDFITFKSGTFNFVPTFTGGTTAVDFYFNVTIPSLYSKSTGKPFSVNVITSYSIHYTKLYDFASNRKPGTPRRKFLPGGKNEIGFYQSRAFEKGNLVVLIDESSASASEIFSGAIQDWDRGVIVGRRSFGKGLVQSRIDLPDRSMLRLTTARYYTPSGRCIQKSYAGRITSYNVCYTKLLRF